MLIGDFKAVIKQTGSSGVRRTSVNLELHGSRTSGHARSESDVACDDRRGECHFHHCTSEHSNRRNHELQPEVNVKKNNMASFTSGCSPLLSRRLRLRSSVARRHHRDCSRTIFHRRNALLLLELVGACVAARTYFASQSASMTS